MIDQPSASSEGELEVKMKTRKPVLKGSWRERIGVAASSEGELEAIVVQVGQF